MTWWLLLFICLVWTLYVYAGAAAAGVRTLRDPLPDGKPRGFSPAPIIPVLPLAFWVIAIVIDLVASPWGTRIVEAIHFFMGILFVVSIVQNIREMRALSAKK